MTTTNDTTTTGDQLLDIPQSDLERLLGVATLIERLDARRQLQTWPDFDTSEDEEAAKVASGVSTK